MYNTCARNLTRVHALYNMCSTEYVYLGALARRGDEEVLAVVEQLLLQVNVGIRPRPVHR